MAKRRKKKAWTPQTRTRFKRTMAKKRMARMAEQKLRHKLPRTVLRVSAASTRKSSLATITKLQKTFRKQKPVRRTKKRRQRK